MIEQARAELAEFMERSGKSQAQIARETSLSTATVSQFLNGTYTGDNEKTAAALMKYLDEKLWEAAAIELRAMQAYPEFKPREIFYSELIEMFKKIKEEG